MIKKQTKNKESNSIVEGLDEGEKKSLHRLGVRKTARLIRQLTKAYNKLCPDCRQLVMEDSRRPLETYCPVCKDILRDIMEGVQ
jgi:hypothetical protein